MDEMMRRRRALLSQLGVKRFVIFLNELLEGEVLSSSYSEISNNRINVKGTTTTNSGEHSQSYFKYYQEPDAGKIHYDKPIHTLESLRKMFSEYTESNSKEPGTFYIVDAGENTWRVHWFTAETTSDSAGSIVIGAYDFTKYKTLHFTVDNFKKTGTVSCSEVSIEVTANGSYVMDIKSCKGDYNILFTSSGSSGFSVNNVYLEG